MKKLLAITLKLAVAVAVLFAFAFGFLWFRTGPTRLPSASESLSRLDDGPFVVGTADFEWSDATRNTAANGDFEGAPSRDLPTTVWYPRGAPGPHPLVVYSHGFISQRTGGAYLAEHLASHGYVVVSANFPLSNMQAPGGPNALDVVHQPADVAFLIDQTLALAGDAPFEGSIDPKRIGLFGLSLGGLTTTLATFHPEWRDPRVRAAISIAGPADVFGPTFFDHADVPFLMIGGTIDAIVDYEANASPIPERISQGGLLTLEGGTHVGFANPASGVLRLFGNPDTVGCRLAGEQLEAPPEHPFSGLFGEPEQGLLAMENYVGPCTREFDGYMGAVDQQNLTKLAVHAFFESHLGTKEADRQRADSFLTETFPNEIESVSYQSGSKPTEPPAEQLERSNPELIEGL